MQTTIKFKQQGRIEREGTTFSFLIDVFATPTPADDMPTFEAKIKFWDHTNRKRGMLTMLGLAETFTSPRFVLEHVATIYLQGTHHGLGYTPLPWDASDEE